MEDSGDETLAGDTAEGSVPIRSHGSGRLGRGDRLGRYTVLELLGHGGMGLVYAAYDPQLDRRVAVKVLRTRGTRGATDRGRQRLLREAQAMAKLSHPNVVAVHDVGTVDDEVFLAMEFIDGSSLDRWLAERPRSWREVIAVFAEAGRGLAAAHAAGLVHRDFKPANVLIDRAGRPRVTDFGLAQIGETAALSGSELSAEREPLPTGASLALTEADALMGTPAYMAPEQHARTAIDARTDQFGFCVALYEALYSRHPFGGDTIVALASAVSRGELREPPGDTDVPAHVRRVVTRGLAREPDARWPSIDALLTALLDDPAQRRRRWIGGALGVTGLAGVVAVAAYALPASPEPPPCEGAGDDVEGVWSPARRDAIAKAFAATRQPHAATVWSRSAEVIGGYAARWRDSARDACEATRVRGEQSDSLFDLRRACLGRRLHELDVRLALLEQVDAAMVDHGFEVATSLAPVDVCEDAERLLALVPLPEDPARARAVEALRERLASVAASFDAGRGAQIAEEVAPLVEQAVELGYAPVQGEARKLAAMVQEELGRWRESEALFMQAAQDAAAGHDDRLLATILTYLPHLVGYLQARFADAELLVPLIRAALARVGQPDDLVAKFEHGMGSMRLRQGDQAASRSHYLEAIARYHEDDGSALARSKVLNNLAVLDMLEGEYDRARVSLDQAHAVQSKLLRPDHRDIAAYHQNLGFLAGARADHGAAIEHFDRAIELLRSAQPDGGGEEIAALANRSHELTLVHRFDEARADVERALALAERLHGQDHPIAYAVWQSRSKLERELGQLDQARDSITRALELARAALGEDHPDVGLLLAEAGVIELRAGDLARAAELLDQGLLRCEEGYGSDHPLTAAILRSRGAVDLAQGNPAAARERLERAIEILERRQGDAQELARGRYDLARCLPPQDHARARRLAEKAREYLSAHPATQTEVAAIEAWLAGQPD
jgi:eukaryotic-like serine/threonine-protein kinase